MSQKSFSSAIYFHSSVPMTVAYKSTNTQVSMDDLSINVYAVMPEIGTYLLSKCKTMAYKVLSHAKATACGQNLTVVFVAEPTPILHKNPHGEKGVEIEVHTQKCTSHIVEQYYLARKLGFEINATLLTA
jgi:hypothetical protein